MSQMVCLPYQMAYTISVVKYISLLFTMFESSKSVTDCWILHFHVSTWPTYNREEIFLFGQIIDICSKWYPAFSMTHVCHRLAHMTVPIWTNTVYKSQAWITFQPQISDLSLFSFHISQLLAPGELTSDIVVQCFVDDILQFVAVENLQNADTKVLFSGELESYCWCTVCFQITSGQPK